MEIIGIGARIRQTRKSRKITIPQMASLCHMSCGNISEIERGIYFPSFGKLYSIATLLECDMNWLLTGRTVFSEEELQILQLFRSLNGKQRNELIHILEFEAYING